MISGLNVPLRAAGFGLLVLLVYLFISGYAIEQQTERSLLIAAIWHHIGWAVVMLGLGVVFALWTRLSDRRQDKQAEDSAPQRILARLLLANIVLLLLGGIAMVWLRGSALKVFGWFAIPSPFSRMQSAYEWSEEIHKALVVSLLILAAAWLIQLVYKQLTASDSR